MFSNKNISLLITLLFITSQVVAYSSMVCDMDLNNTDTSMSEMDHSKHNMDMMDSDTNTENANMDDCCDFNCKCSIGSCSSIFLFGSVSKSTKFLNPQSYILSKDHRISSVEISSLNPPPITC